MNITEIIEVIVYDYMWGTPMIVFILAAGLYFTARSGLFQFRFFGHAIKTVVKRLFKGGDSAGEGTFSPMQALSTALGSTVRHGKYKRSCYRCSCRRPGSSVLAVGSRTFRYADQDGGDHPCGVLPQKRC